MTALALIAPAGHDALALLEAAHARIETSLAMLERLAAHVARHGADAEAREAARVVVRFFDTAGRDHQRDEDQHVFPLLREKAAELDRPELSAVMNEVQADHAAMDGQWARVRAWLQALAGGLGTPAPAAQIAGFASLQRRHMAQETAVILPFARETLDPAARRSLNERMAKAKGCSG